MVEWTCPVVMALCTFGSVDVRREKLGRAFLRDGPVRSSSTVARTGAWDGQLLHLPDMTACGVLLLTGDPLGVSWLSRGGVGPSSTEDGWSGNIPRGYTRGGRELGEADPSSEGWARQNAPSWDFVMTGLSFCVYF